MKPQALAPQTGRLIEAISRLEDFLDWFIYSENTIDGQSKKAPKPFLKWASGMGQLLT